jgi:L-lysine 6-transaminase
MGFLPIKPENVIPVLREHILVDGFHVVIDLDRSHGSWIRDAVTGREILDFYAYFASLPVGHNHPALKTDAEFVEALRRASIANPANSDIYCAELATFVDQLTRLAMPKTMRHMFFVAGGALAVENALKTAFDWKVRKNRAAGRGDLGSQILHFREAFHGRSGYTMSLTNTDPVKTDLYPKFNWPRVINPKLEFPLTDEGIAHTLELERRAVSEIEAAFARFPHDIAAIIIEPIQGEGGDNHFRPEFFHALRRLADEHDAMLIFDEVQTGVGTTGRMWAHEHFGVSPDILVFGKKAQVCGIMVGSRVDEVPDNVFKVSSRINSTWGGSLADMVRGTKYLEIIREEKLIEHAAVVGERLVAGMQAIAQRRPIVTNVRGRGTFFAFTLPSQEVRNQVRQACWDLGLATLTSGPRSIRFRPCLNVSFDEIDTGLNIVELAIQKA